MYQDFMELDDLKIGHVLMHDDAKDEPAGNREQCFILALSSGTHGSLAFQCGALMALQRLGLLYRVDRICSSGVGNLLTGALASAWTKVKCVTPADATEVKRVGLNAARKTHRSWSSLVGIDCTDVRVWCDADLRKRHEKLAAAMHGLDVLPLNKQLVDLVITPVLEFVEQPHEWHVFRRRVCKPWNWTQPYSEELHKVLNKALDLNSVRGKPLSLGSLTHDEDDAKARELEHFDPHFVFNALQANQLVQFTPAVGAKSHEVQLDKLLASCGLPGPPGLFGGLELPHRDARRYGSGVVNSASGEDPLALRTAIGIAERLPGHKIIGIDGVVGMPHFEEMETRLQHGIHATIERAEPLLYCDRLVSCLAPDLRVSKTHAPNKLDFSELMVSDLHAFVTQCGGWSDRMNGLSRQASYLLVNWGFYLTVCLYATSEQLRKLKFAETPFFPCPELEAVSALQELGIDPLLIHDGRRQV